MLLKTCTLFLLRTVYAFLQPHSALSQVHGTVRDHNGKGLANVHITVNNKFSTCSDRSGRYSLYLVPGSGIPITYRIKGYKLGGIKLGINSMKKVRLPILMT